MNQNIIILGSQWGDEGKGKIVDLLTDKADAVVRFQGGYNAGHTLVINGPNFAKRLEITEFEPILINNNWFMGINNCRLVEKDSKETTKITVSSKELI